MTIVTAGLVTVVICFSYFFQAAFAFGGPLIAVPLLSLFINPKDAVVLTTVFSILGNILILKLWKDIDWRQLAWLIPSLILGLLLGLVLFASLNQKLLAIVLAVYIIFYASISISKSNVFAKIFRNMPRRLECLASGLSGGFIQGATGMGGGPPIVVYLKKHSASINEFRATFMGAWLIANVFRFFFMQSKNFVSKDIIAYTIITAPFFFVAIYVGYHVPKKIEQKSFNLALNILLLISAISILAKELT